MQPVCAIVSPSNFLLPVASSADRILANAANPPAGRIDVDNKKDFNIEEINKWRQDSKLSKTIDYRISKNYDGSATFIIQNGKEVQKIPLSAEQFNNYFPRYAAVNPITRMKYLTLSSPENTTNAVKKGDPVNAAFSGYSLPLLQDTTIASRVRYDVEGSSRNVGDRNGRYLIRVYVFDGKIWHQEIINQKGYIGEEEIQDKLNNIGMDVVNHILKKQYGNFR